MAEKSRSRRPEKTDRTDVASSLGQSGIVPPAGA
jgi:hypothetical protein